MRSSKQSINHLCYLTHHYGVRDIVFSPGSRNAPLVISFASHEGINKHVVTDERSAGFVALGMALAQNKPTAICCTSGSAAANYTPAICEAYYSGIPLIVLTADRPVEYIDQGMGQSIRQKNMFSNFVKGSFELIQEAETDEDIKHNDDIINKAFQLALTGKKGPVHINVPLHEPLYSVNNDFNESHVGVQDFQVNTDEFRLAPDLESIWRESRRKIIIYGVDVPGNEIQDQLNTLAENQAVLLTETCSNVRSEFKLGCIDRLITSFEGNEQAYLPDLIITLGGAVISKKIKKLFQKFSPDHFWHVSQGNSQDMFQCLTQHIKTDTGSFLKAITSVDAPDHSEFQSLWMDRDDFVRNNHNRFIKDCPYSDLSVFDVLLNELPDSCVVHLANSTPVRYAQLFDQNPDVVYYSNRGVSGIDGSSSTALGFASKSHALNVLITGDLSFFYDSNAFFNKLRPSNFKIIIINNSGGGIFRIIDGPSSTEHLDKFFEANHDYNAQKLSEHYKLGYISVNTKEALAAALPEFMKPSSEIQVLEIHTPGQLNADVLKSYFEALKQEA